MARAGRISLQMRLEPSLLATLALLSTSRLREVLSLEPLCLGAAIATRHYQLLYHFYYFYC